MFLKNFAKLTESYKCRRLYFNRVEGCRLEKKNNSGAGAFLWILRKFWELLSSTYANCSFWYLGISLLKNILYKVYIEEMHSFLQHLVFVYFKLILESCRTSGVYLELYQTYVIQKHSLIDIWEGSKYDSAATFLKYFSSFFVWIIEWIYEHFVVLLNMCS